MINTKKPPGKLGTGQSASIPAVSAVNPRRSNSTTAPIPLGSRSVTTKWQPSTSPATNSRATGTTPLNPKHQNSRVLKSGKHLAAHPSLPSVERQKENQHYAVNNCPSSLWHIQGGQQALKNGDDNGANRRAGVTADAP